MKLTFWVFPSYEQISVLLLKSDVSGTSDIQFSKVFSLVSYFKVINGLVLDVIPVRGEEEIVFKTILVFSKGQRITI